MRQVFGFNESEVLRIVRIRSTSDCTFPNYVCRLSVRFNKVLFETLDSEVLRIPGVRKGSSGIF